MFGIGCKQLCLSLCRLKDSRNGSEFLHLGIDSEVIVTGFFKLDLSDSHCQLSCLLREGSSPSKVKQHGKKVINCIIN